MSEKRFILCNKTTDSNVWDTLDKQCYGWEYVVYLLNELNEENDVLKQQLKTKYVVNKQYEELQRLKKDNKELKAQLYCEGSVCTICKHHQLTPDKVMQGYYTSKCEKGHKACSKEDLKHCKDFKLEGLSE